MQSAKYHSNGPPTLVRTDTHANRSCGIGRFRIGSIDRRQEPIEQARVAFALTTEGGEFERRLTFERRHGNHKVFLQLEMERLSAGSWY